MSMDTFHWLAVHTRHLLIQRKPSEVRVIVYTKSYLHTCMMGDISGIISGSSSNKDEYLDKSALHLE